MSELVGEECKDQGHAWAGDSEWYIIGRWIGRGESRRWRRIAERRSPCMRGDCGATAVDRAIPSTLTVMSRHLEYHKPEYLRQTIDGEPASRRKVRTYRAQRQGVLSELKE